MRLTAQDIRIGAIYKVAAERGLSREAVTSLLATRASLKPAEAEQLAHHWFTTEPLCCWERREPFPNAQTTRGRWDNAA